MNEPVTFCNVCNARVYPPLNVVEVSMFRDGNPWVGRSILCPGCIKWVLEALRIRKAPTRDPAATIPLRPVR